MIKKSFFSVFFIFKFVVCQQNPNSAGLSHRFFSQPVFDDQANTLQIGRNNKQLTTRIFYSTISNNFQPNQNPPIVQPTFPTNSLISGRDNRRRKASKKLSFENRKFCLNCLTDFKIKPYNTKDFCLNPLGNTTEAKLRFLNMCPETSQHCQTEVYTINGVLSALERRCSTICKSNICFQRSYGTETESCVYCCPMFESDELNEEDLKHCPVQTFSSVTEKSKKNRGYRISI